MIRERMAEEFKAAIGSRFEERVEVAYALQELEQIPPGFTVPGERAKPWGTGHAVLAAADQVSTPFAVINADDFYGQTSYATLADFLVGTGTSPEPKYALVAFTLRKTLSDHGYVARGICTADDQGELQKVVELTRIERAGTGAVNTADDGTITRLNGDEPVSMNRLIEMALNVYGVIGRVKGGNISSRMSVPSSLVYRIGEPIPIKRYSDSPLKGRKRQVREITEDLYRSLASMCFE